MSEPFTPEQIPGGRRTFHRFMSFNVIAFSILTGNVISVFALKLDVSNTYIGLLQSFVHLSMVFILVGRLMMQTMSSVRVFAIGWFMRYVFASLLLVIPWLVDRTGNPALATAAILVATAGFHIFRGIGVAGQVPIVAGLAMGADRGQFLSVNSILANAIALAGGLGIALLLGADAPLSRFVATFAVAILCGFVSVIFVVRMPEPLSGPDQSFGAFVRDVRAVGSRPRVARLLVYVAGFGLGTSAIMAFLVVIAKRVFLMPDNFSVFLVAVGNLGAVVAGVINRRLVDDVGGKPLIVFYQSIALALSLSVALFLPLVSDGARLAMMVLFFAGAAVQGGTFVTTQTYFFGALPGETQRNLGMLYSLVTGAAGAIGAYLAGPLLDAVEARAGTVVAFQVLYGSIAVVAAAALLVAISLPPDGRERVRRGFKGMLRSLRRLFR